MIAGIDFGSKLAGTTVIAFLKEKELHWVQSLKKQDADAMIRKFIEAHPQINDVYIDAPLSLPSALIGNKEGNYFYRESDRLLKAMSPMFLGGLTARAIQLKHQLETSVNIYEVYPGGLIRNNEVLKDNYIKKNLEKLPSFTEQLINLLPFPLAKRPSNWHQVDSLLAWFIGWKHQHGDHQAFGNEKEGQIFI